MVVVRWIQGTDARPGGLALLGSRFECNNGPRRRQWPDERLPSVFAWTRCALAFRRPVEGTRMVSRDPGGYARGNMREVRWIRIWTGEVW